VSDTPANPEFVIAGPDIGARLDIFLGQRLGVGRAQVKKLLASGRVRLNGHPASEKSKGLFLREGSRVTVEGFAPATAAEVVPEPDLPLTVLAEGDGWVAVDKPAGMAVHPLEPGETGTVLNSAVARYPQIQGVGEAGLRSGVVHRLDVGTTGVLLFATAQPAWQRLRDAFSAHTTKKVYRALVDGELKGSGRETMDLVVIRHTPAKVGVVNPTQGYRPPGTRTCHLTWRTIEKLNGATLLEIELGTGFLHQIRVMLAHLGHPVVGDGLYGDAEAGIPRPMLHASYLKADTAEARSPDPDDFLRALKRLRA
jgi:23S rRNA pseudouridine1911/1915/1917 synthase